MLHHPENKRTVGPLMAVEAKAQWWERFFIESALGVNRVVIDNTRETRRGEMMFPFRSPKEFLESFVRGGLVQGAACRVVTGKGVRSRLLAQFLCL